MRKTGVSVVIPSFNCKKMVFRLVESLKKTTYPTLEVIVVDNGSQDGTIADGQKKYKWVRWVDAGKVNIGQTGCYNLGFAYAKRNNHVLYCDSDVVVDKGMVLKLVERIESDPKIGIVTPMIVYLSDKNFVNQAGAEVNLFTGRVRVGWGPKKDFSKAKQVQNSGTVMLFKNVVLKKIGGFEDWFMCYFDPEYCLRAKKAGFQTWYEPAAIAYHDQSKNPQIWRPRVLGRAYLLGRNRVLFMRKYGNILSFIIFLPLILGYYLVEALRFNRLSSFFQLLAGSIVGFFYPLESKNYIPLPKITSTRT